MTSARELIDAHLRFDKRVERESEATFVDWNAFWARDRSSADWLLQNILARGRGHSIYAPHKLGKSLLALWCSVQLVGQGTAVVYLDYEMGEDDLYERLEDMGCGPATDLSLLHYALLPNLPPLDTANGAAALLAKVDEVIAGHSGCEVAVVIDTISRAVQGGENEADTVRDFYRHTGLGLKQRGATWARLDHAGKDRSRGQRGTSAKGDDVDLVWRLSKKGESLELRREASRMGWVPERVTLELVSDPFLAFRQAPPAWPAGTHECVEDLDQLSVPLDASIRDAETRLKAASKGRRRQVVAAALRFRREGREPPSELPSANGGEPPSGVPSRTPTLMGRNHPGNRREPTTEAVLGTPAVPTLEPPRPRPLLEPKRESISP